MQGEVFPEIADRALMYLQARITDAESGLSMGDQESRPPIHQPVHRFKDGIFCLRINRTGRFIKNQQWRPFEKCPCQRDPLSLSTG